MARLAKHKSDATQENLGYDNSSVDTSLRFTTRSNMNGWLLIHTFNALMLLEQKNQISVDCVDFAHHRNAILELDSLFSICLDMHTSLQILIFSFRSNLLAQFCV